MASFDTGIILGAFNIFTVFVVWRFYFVLFEKKKVRKANFLIGNIALVLFGTFMNYRYEHFVITIIVTICINMCIAIVYFRGKWHVKFVAALFGCLFSFISEIITTVIFNIAFTGVISQIRENPSYFLLGGVISRIIYLVLIEFIRRRQTRKANQISIKSWLLILLIPFMSIVLIMINLYDPLTNDLYNNKLMVTSIILLLVNLIAYYLFDSIIEQIDENSKMQTREEHLLSQKEYYESVRKNHESMRKVYHDMRAHLSAIEGYASLEDWEGVLSYIHRLDDSLGLEKIIMYTENTVINALLNSKLNEALEREIKVRHTIAIPNRFKMNEMDVCVVVGNLLNNAFEGCNRIKRMDVPRRIEIIMKYKNGRILIKIINSYNKETIHKKGEKFETSKKRKDLHGIGIENVKEIVGKYDGTMNISDGEMFEVDITLLDK